ncbi:glucose-1-phosphate cytidylyltransferase [Lachnospiraceae bacterium]|nr:glucose-1-phosphate cytidylyltransferase [Lachnospiraceae bacterium]
MIISTYTNKKNANGGNKLKVVILAGGFGTRISEESHLKPKPMIEIGEKPILWHIMKLYSHYGYNEFVICCGYKQHVIKEWFADYYLHNSDITFDFTEQNQMTIHNNVAEPWKVTLVDTGLHTMTGGRIKRIQQYIGDNPFLLTYGDGVSDINIDELVKYHENQGKLVTLSAYNVGQRFGILNLDESNNITSFREKSSNDGSLVNIGFMVCRPELFDYIKGDDVVLEKYPLETLAAKGELTAYKHEGFWQCMDTQRDKQQLENMWESGKAPWKIWK